MVLRAIMKGEAPKSGADAGELRSLHIERRRWMLREMMEANIS